MNEGKSDSSAAERSLQALLDNMPDLIFFKDADSRFTRVNPAHAAFVGAVDPAAVIGKTDADFFPEATARAFRADEHQLLTTGEPLIAKPEAHCGADGQTHWVLTTKVPIRDRDGQITGLVGIARDITALKQVEDDLRQSERRHRGLLAEARRQAQERALFDEVRTALAREVELGDLFRTVVEAIARTFGYTLVSLYLVEDGILVLQHQVGYDQVAARVPVTDGVSGRVVRTGEAVLLADVRTDPAFIAAIPGILSEVCVPLYDAGRVVGTLNVESRDEISLTDADLDLIVALSEHVNVAIGRARLYTEVRQSEARFGSLIRNALDIITIIDGDGAIRYESPAVERILGYQPDELVGRHAFDLVHPAELPTVHATFLAALDDPTLTPTVEFRFRHMDGSWCWLEATGTNLLADPAVGGFVVNSRDITARKETDRRLWHQAHHDPLTGLPNRALFLGRLAQALSTPEPTSVAVFFLDLDGFKVVNDSLGHEYGDRLLIATAGRLTSTLRTNDLLARFGGDEFTILQEQMSGVQEATRMAQRLLAALAVPFTLNGHEVVVSAGVGVVLSAPDLANPSDLLRAADVALYRAKASGKGGIAVFEATRDASALARLDRETALRHALELGEFRLHYQPKVDLSTGRMGGVEALVRWQHPVAGLLPPDAFIPLAEETGLIVPLGEWILREACRQVMAWAEQVPEAGLLGLCVNLSPLQVRHPDLVGQVAGMLCETGCPPERLTLEITERGLIEDTGATDRAVGALKALGVRLAIDDFGSYQAGLGYLRRWPMDMIKLDRTLVADLDGDERSRAVVTAIVALAQALGMEVTGEGIETAAQGAQLRDLGCTWGQGHLFAPAMPADELVGFLERGRSVGG